MEHEIELRLRWRQTWDDKENDFAAEAAGYPGTVGRIYYFDFGPQKGLWFWAMNAHGPEISRNIGKASGTEPSARLAGKCVEDAWFAAIKGSSLDVPATLKSTNSYAAAKGRA